ncbi:MAG: threonine transporter [Rhodocyclales bacterium RIFCSPLOWO2_02_FULL_63_24]|nr:MAG: threonine transporter [Rhodocyclales bacterium RIFCSPLOWO2_02_FULL_63_24]
MAIALALLSIAGAISLGAMSPGPSFIMVARTALAISRMDGVAAALGMGVGGVLFAVAALLGLQALLGAVPAFYAIVKVLGGAYLLYLGYLIWRGASEPLSLAATQTAGKGKRALRRSFLLGLGTQVSNPKTAVVYASIFVSLLPRELPPAALLGLPLLIFAIETGWYSIVALALSAPSPRATYLRSKSKLDRIAGGVMAALGIKLMVGARQL